MLCIRALPTNKKTKRSQRDHLPKPNLNGGPPASARDPEKCSCGFRTRSRAEKKGSGAPKGALSSQCPRQARLRAARLAARRLSALALAALATGSTRWLSPRTGFPAALAGGCFARFAQTMPRLPWGKSMIVLPGTESRSTPDIATPDGRTDIPLIFIEVFLTAGEHDPHAIIECKRLAEGDAALIREYVTEGIDRFCANKYGRAHSRGFMAGYVLAGSPNSVVSQINAFLEKHSRESEHLTGDLSGFWKSRHPRKNWREVQLHHGMFLVSA